MTSADRDQKTAASSASDALIDTMAEQLLREVLDAAGPHAKPLATDATATEPAIERLFEALQDAPREHDFFATLRRLEALHPSAPRIGRALRPAQEALRLGQDAELDFAPAALSSFDRAADGKPPRLGVRFFGLFGPQGPMPLHLTEYVRERQRFRGDATAARFFDIFHHRLLALFYRAWGEVQPAAHHDRPNDDRFAAWLGTAFGFEGVAAAASRPLPANARLFQAGLLGARSRHPEGLAKLLAQHFGVPVRIESHVAQWLVFDAADRSRLGVARGLRGGLGAAARAQLGQSATSGSKLRDRQYKFRIVLGPLTRAQYHGFLPGGAAWAALSDWVHHYSGLDLRWDVQLSLAVAEVPVPRLGDPAVRLGLTAWVGEAQRKNRGDEAGSRPLALDALPIDKGLVAAQAADRAALASGPHTRAHRDLRLRPDTSFLLRHGGHHA